jgi:predicted MFS family arabinose efflux permease
VTYRRVFATPGLRSLLLVGLLGKVPAIGVPAVLLVQVVQGLGLGFGPASVVSAAWTLGIGIGAPFQGTAMDRYGLRPLIAVVVFAQAAFWLFSPLLPYPLLVAAAFGAGVLNVPAFTVVRLGLAVLVDDDIRHTAYVADSITTDIAYMVGPSAGIVLAAQVSPRAAFLVMGGMIGLSCVGFALANPRLRSARVERTTSWLSVRLVAVLGMTIAVAVAVFGFEVAAIGTLQRLDQLSWTWAVLVLAGAASIAGGLVYGALRHPPPPALLAVGLAVLVAPIGFAGHWAWLCVLAIPANLLIAPALSATADAVSRLAPAGSKGVAMGAYASALMVGNVAGAPVAGVAMDAGGPVASFAAVGAVSVVIAVAMYALSRRPTTANRIT